MATFVLCIAWLGVLVHLMVPPPSRGIGVCVCDKRERVSPLVAC